MELTCPQCSVPGVTPEIPGILPRTVYCGNCRTLVTYRGSLLEFLVADNEDLMVEDVALSWDTPIYLTPKYRTKINFTRPVEVPIEEVLREVPTKMLFHLFRACTRSREFYGTHVHTRQHGRCWVTLEQLKEALDKREHLPRTKSQKKALKQVQAQTRQEYPRYLERDGFVVVCRCSRILNDQPSSEVPEQPNVRRYLCKASADVIFFDIVLKTRVERL